MSKEKFIASIEGLIKNMAVEIYEKAVEFLPKNDSVIWNDRTGNSSMAPPRRTTWVHDVTGERFSQMYYLEEKYPEFALKWIDGEFGGYHFVSGTVSFKTIQGVRGFGYKAVVAFDGEGFGAVFFE